MGHEHVEFDRIDRVRHYDETVFPEGGDVVCGSFRVRHAVLVGLCNGKYTTPISKTISTQIPPRDRCNDTLMNMKARVTKITDVARAADTSPATVSRVLNGTGGVSPELKARVLKVAASLGYVPDGSARALRRQHASVWAAIVSDIENPFFTAVVRGIEDVARQAHHRLVLCNSDEDLEREADYIDVAIAERMAGVVIAVASGKESSNEAFSSSRGTFRWWP